MPENNIQNPVVGIPAAYTQSGMDQVAGESVVMTYKMLGISGQEVLATSLVFTPKVHHQVQVGQLWLGHMERQVWLIFVRQVVMSWMKM